MLAAAPPGLRSSGCSHVGHVREVNEDGWLARPHLGSGCGLWAVADGMGGHQKGDAASALVVRALSEVAAPSAGHLFLEDVRDRLEGANADMRALAETLGPGAVVGCTVVALLIYGGHFLCLWAGDSRAYRLRDGAFGQLTRDHSVVQTLVDAGALTPEAARRHGQANVLTRALGCASEAPLGLTEGALAVGDRFLLCSDGLTNLVSDPEAARLLARADAAEALVALALERGAPDNVTAVVVEA